MQRPNTWHQNAPWLSPGQNTTTTPGLFLALSTSFSKSLCNACQPASYDTVIGVAIATGIF